MNYDLVGGGVITTTTKLGEGGEGIVFAATDEKVAVKIYHKPLAGVAGDKLRSMVTHSIGPLAEHAAWPKRLVAGNGGAIAGLVMPKASEPFDIHAIYNPQSRLERLPAADWKYLIQVAMNVCAAVHAAHGAGVVIGDVNHGSVRVAENGHVRLIDCDSFQIQSGNRIFRCGVGVDAYTPPELQGVSLADVDRTVDHDRFGLAVMIFHLLMMGRHPFSGVPQTSSAPTDIPDAIRQRAYAYQAGSRQLAPPPSAPKIAMLSQGLADLFERAFTTKGKRPDAGEWHKELAAFQAGLKDCPKNRCHKQPAHLSECPWCAFAEAGIDFFPPAHFTGPLNEDRFDLAALAQAWAKVERVRAQVASIPYQNVTQNGGDLTVDIAPRLQQARLAQPSAEPLYVWMGRARKGAAIATVGAGCIGLFTEGLVGSSFALVIGALVVWGLGWRLSLLAAKLEEANADLRRQARLASAPAVASIDAMTIKVVGHRANAEELAKGLAEHQKRIRSAPRELQLKTFLSRHPITVGCAPGIGASRVSQLSSFSIDTAADLETQAILAVPGFGSSLAQALMGWRRELESRFRYNPTQRPDPRALAKLSAGSRPQLRKYWKEVNAIRQIGDQLEKAATSITQSWTQADATIAKRAVEIAQIDANTAALKFFNRTT